jgi:uncharacterized protein (UPF0147 family)
VSTRSNRYVLGPYINHLVEVAMLVADATGGKDTNLVIAALLHDVIEDCEVPRELIAETFGEDVASLAEEVTDDKSLPKAVRKNKQVKTAPTKSSRVSGRVIGTSPERWLRWRPPRARTFTRIAEFKYGLGWACSSVALLCVPGMPGGAGPARISARSELA